MCLSDIEDLLDMRDVDCFGSSTVDKCAQTNVARDDADGAANATDEMEGEVAELLAELSSKACNFDATDYWVDGDWDLESLREDVQQQRRELLQTQQNTQPVPIAEGVVDRASANMVLECESAMSSCENNNEAEAPAACLTPPAEPS